MPSPPLSTREYAYFAVTGQGSSSAITELLRWKPSQEWSEGDSRPRGGVYPAMRWRLDSGLEDTAPLEAHVRNLFLTLPSRSAEIRSLAPDYKCYIVCVGYYPATGHGLHIEHEWAQAASHLGLSFDLDFYFISDYGHDG